MSEEKKKGSIGALIMFIIIAVLLGAYFIIDANTVKFEITEAKMYFNGSKVTIAGKCKNLTNDTTSITIEYAIFDYEGNNIGTAFAYVKNIGSGETAYFQAELLRPTKSPYTYKLVKVKSYDYLKLESIYNEKETVISVSFCLV